MLAADSGNLAFTELFGNLATSSPLKENIRNGFNSHNGSNNSNYISTTPPKHSFDNFQVGDGVEEKTRTLISLLASMMPIESLFLMISTEESSGAVSTSHALIFLLSVFSLIIAHCNAT